MGMPLVLDIEMGRDDEELLALFDGTPPGVIKIYPGLDSGNRILELRSKAGVNQARKDGRGRWRCIAFAGRVPESLVGRAREILGRS
jgi:hypothetical protein